MAYLGELHPELFIVPPRPGGLAKIVPPKPETEETTGPEKGSKVTNKAVEKSSMLGKASVRSYGQASLGGMSKRSSMKSTTGSAFEAAFLTSTPENNSREYRIKKVLNTSQWMPPDYDDDPSISMPSSDPINNVMMILSLAISTIMLLPTQFDYIPKDNLRWTLSYLECIKDESGNYPPNVRGIMNQIKLIDNTIESFNETVLNEAVATDVAAQGVITAAVPEPAAPAAPDAAAPPAPVAAEPAVPEQPEPAAPEQPEPAAPEPPEPAAPEQPEPADPNPPEPADPNPDDIPADEA